MARPQITGTVIRRVELHCTAGRSNKDYVITMTGVQNGYLVLTEYGPHRKLQNGKYLTPSPVSLASATKIVDDLVAEKRQNKGYQLVSDERLQQAQSAMQPPKPKKKARAAPNASLDQLPATSRAGLVRMF